MRYVFGFLMALAVAVTGCDGAGGTGGTGGGGGNCGDPVDFAGEWEMTSTVVSDDCDGRMSQTFGMMITQDGNAITAETFELTFDGTICGTEIQMSGSFPEDVGTVTVDATLTVSVDGNSMEGADSWTWTDGSESCSGSDSLSATRIAVGCEGVVDGTACGGGACLDGVCTALTTVSGTVDFGGAPPGEGSQITVSVDGTSLSTTTDVSGGFSFAVFPGEWFFVTSKEDTVWGEIKFISVPSTGQSNLQLWVGFDDNLPAFEEECGIELDEAKGFVSLYFVSVSGAGGETATLSVPYGGALTEDADGNCVVSEMILPDVANPFGSMELEFFNVDLTENLVVTPIAPEGYECALEHPETVIPVRASFLTGLVDVLCMPVP